MGGREAGLVRWETWFGKKSQVDGVRSPRVSQGCLSCVLYSESQQSGDLSDQQGRASALAPAVRQTAQTSDLRQGLSAFWSPLYSWARWGRAFRVRGYNCEFQEENSYRDSSDHLTFSGKISFSCFSASNCSTQNRLVSRVPSGGNCQGFQPFPTQLLVRRSLRLPGELNTSVLSQFSAACPVLSPLNLVYPSHLK